MILKVTNLSKSFQVNKETLEILKDVNIEIKKPSIIAIVGPSGSGKTTLISLLAGLERSTSGSIMINNQELTEMNEEELSLLRQQKIGFIFQNAELVEELNVRENIEIPLHISGTAVDEKKILQIIKDLRLDHRIQSSSRTLSGGEKQRVAIARSLINQPEIIFADEPTGNLDEKTGLEVMNSMIDLVKKYQTTIIVITHDSHIAQMADMTYVLKNKTLQLQK